MKRFLLFIGLILISFAMTSCNKKTSIENEETAEATKEPTPEATEEKTPEATEEKTPEATEEKTPEETKEKTPEATEEKTPEATEEETVEVKGVNVTSADNARTIEVGATLQLTAVVYPAEASQEVVWSSDNAEVATVSENGLVTAVKVGKVNIIATSKENSTISKAFALIVEEAAEEKEVEPTGITISSFNNETTCLVGGTINLSATVSPQEANQTVIWTSSDETIATVRRGEVLALKAGEVTITATVKNYEDITASIVLTIEQGDAPVVSAEWSEMAFTEHSVFLEAEKETKIKVKGVVTHIAQPDKNGKVSYFVQNGVHGFYVYAQDVSVYPVELGKVYEVGGYKKYYNGLNEIVNVEYFVESTDEITFEVLNIEDTNPTSLSDMMQYQSSYVTAKATFVSGTVNTKAFNVIVKVNGYDTTLRIDPAVAGPTEFAAICEELANGVAGVNLEFTGLMSAFGYGSAKPQVQIVKASQITISEATTEDILNACKGALSVTESVGFQTEEIEIPTVVEGFEDVTISWTSDNNCISPATGKVTHDSQDVVVTLKATLTLKGVTVEKEFKVLVFALDNTEYEVVASLDLDDALDGNKYGCSETKSGYAEGVVSLGTPKHNWLMRNALIGCDGGDKYEGKMSIRAKAGKSAEGTARIEIQEAGEYNVIELAVATYGTNPLGSKIRIEYTTDDKTWETSPVIITVNSYELEAFRVKLPEGVKRVAIVVVENSGQTVNIDNIKFMK